MEGIVVEETGGMDGNASTEDPLDERHNDTIGCETKSLLTWI